MKHLNWVRKEISRQFPQGQNAGALRFPTRQISRGYTSLPSKDSGRFGWDSKSSQQVLNGDNQEYETELASSSNFQSVYFPVYVMLPLDSIWVAELEDGEEKAYIQREGEVIDALHKLKSCGVEGVMIDVWWGQVERDGPKQYDFSAYYKLFQLVRDIGLKVQAVMSFHAAGSNIGDTCKIPLPSWVLQQGAKNPDIFFTDITGRRNMEYISFGCDTQQVLWQRTPIQAYKDFIEEFCNQFSDLFGNCITEITVGLGPAGELRYPSYPEGDSVWRFPGIGAFQCYDRYLLDDLNKSAKAIGQPLWGTGGPHNAGDYNSRDIDTEFFHPGFGSWKSDYGNFFLQWYSNLLVQHADRVLGAASEVLNQGGRPRFFKSVSQFFGSGHLLSFEPSCQLGAKLAGIHWYYNSEAHAAELTAGYYNVRGRNGYMEIMKVLKKYNSRLSFTCVEMRDCDQPAEAHCSPEGLLDQVIDTAQCMGVPILGENALQCYDQAAFDRIAESAFGRTAARGRLEQLTFLRMGGLMFENWEAFSRFVKRMSTPPMDGSM